MRGATTFAERLAPDTITRLLAASKNRFTSAEVLQEKGRRLEALYLCGYTAEISLAAAYFRRAGFAANAVIDTDTRRRRMAQATLLQMPNGEPVMTREPHPLVGWAQLLQYSRTKSGDLAPADVQLLQGAVNKARLIYGYWRPELRYKVAEVGPRAIREVQRATKWLVDNQGNL